MKRTKARESALACLYSLEMREKKGTIEDRLRETGISGLDRETKEFALALVSGVCAQIDFLDDLISRLADKWDIERVGLVEKNILRLAIHEMIRGGQETTPPRVVIDEAIEMSRKFGGEESYRFVNGVLDRALKEYFPGKTGARHTSP